MKYTKHRGIALILAGCTMVGMLSGCKSKETQTMIDYINNDTSITVGVSHVTSEQLQGDNYTSLDWEPLDQIKTYNMGFRQTFDRIFNINTVRDNSDRDTGSKQGCLFVSNVDGKEVNNGNASLADAFRNKVFVEDYWKDRDVQRQLTEACEEAYSDVDRNSSYSISASLNAYYNLTPDGKSGEKYYYNPTEILSREQFYTLLLKATSSQYDITDSSDFESAIGTDSRYLTYASQVAKYGFLPYENKSLDNQTIAGDITKVEAVYMLVQMYFPDLYAQMTDTSPNFSDVPAGGDIAVNIGFKEVQKGEGDKPDTIIEKNRWQTYTLAYMLGHTDKGMQSELYRALAVAKQVGIITGSISGWDKAINKHDAIVLIVNTLLAKNKVDGYLTTTEYAEIVTGNEDTTNDIEDGNSVINIDDLFGNDGDNVEDVEDAEDIGDGTENTKNTDRTTSNAEEVTDGTEETNNTEVAGGSDNNTSIANNEQSEPDSENSHDTAMSEDELVEIINQHRQENGNGIGNNGEPTQEDRDWISGSINLEQ